MLASLVSSQTAPASAGPIRAGDFLHMSRRIRNKEMKTEAFMELVSGISYSISSVKSCPQSDVQSELARLQKSITTVRECQWPKRLSDSNREKALRLMNLGNQELCERS